MTNDCLKTMVFSKNSDFRNEFVGRLKCVGINDTVCADSLSFVGSYIVPGMRGVVIYDTRSGDEIMKRLIRQKRISERDYFCIYVCEQSYSGSCAKPFVNFLRLERPFSVHDFYMVFFYASHELCRRKSDSECGFPKTVISVAVTNLLKRLGIPANIKGFGYLKTAVCEVVYDPCAIELITKNLYIHIARLFGTSACCAERAMRNAIDIAWRRGSKETIARYYKDFGFLEKRPTNTAFIASTAEIIRAKLSEGDYTLG